MMRVSRLTISRRFFSSVGTTKFTQSDEWMRVVEVLENNDFIVTFGITHFAQSQLGDLVFVDISKSVDDQISKGDVVCSVESVKATSDIESCIEGTIVEINEALDNEPEIVNDDAQSSGWIVKIKTSDSETFESLMDEKEYTELTANKN